MQEVVTGTEVPFTINSLLGVRLNSLNSILV